MYFPSIVIPSNLPVLFTTVPSPFGLRSVALPSVYAKELITRCIHVLTRAK